MIWLIAQMWALLSAAFFIGIATGWWMWGPRDTRAASVDRNADVTGSLAADEAFSESGKSKVAAE